MRPKSLVLLILALGCGLVASIGISEIIDSQKSEAPPAETEAILVAKADIERSVDLSAENLMLEDWPKDKIPAGAIRDLAEVEGRRPALKITSGMPILESMIGSGEGGRATDEIPKGYRVVAVRVTDESGANLIRPGDRVDLQIYARQNPGLGIDRTGTWTFLQDISVFAVNAEIRSDADNDQPIQARTISLLVTPAQAAKVTLATEIGEVRLVMRGSQDDEGAEETVASIRDIINTTEKFEGEQEDVQPQQTAASDNKDASMLDWLQEQQNQAPAGGTGWQMVVLRGADMTVEQFDASSPLPTTITGNETTQDASSDSTTDVNDSSDDTQDSDSSDDSARDSDGDESQED